MHSEFYSQQEAAALEVGTKLVAADDDMKWASAKVTGHTKCAVKLQWIGWSHLTYEVEHSDTFSLSKCTTPARANQVAATLHQAINDHKKGAKSKRLKTCGPGELSQTATTKPVVPVISAGISSKSKTRAAHQLQHQEQRKHKINQSRAESCEVEQPLSDLSSYKDQQAVAWLENDDPCALDYSDEQVTGWLESDDLRKHTAVQSEGRILRSSSVHAVPFISGEDLIASAHSCSV